MSSYGTAQRQLDAPAQVADWQTAGMYKLTESVQMGVGVLKQITCDRQHLSSIHN